MPAPAMGARAIALPDGRVMITGGCSRLTRAHTSLWAKDSDCWEPTGSLHTDRYEHGIGVLDDGTVLVVGGLQSKAEQPLETLSSTEIWRSDGLWSVVAPLPIAIAGPEVVVLQTGEVLVTGGYDDNVSRACFLLDRAAGSWSETGSLAVPRGAHTATLLADGRVLVVGGMGDFDGVSHATAEVWDPTNGRWTTMPGPQSPRFGHSATRLQDGRVLVVGGKNDGVGLATAELWSPD